MITKKSTIISSTKGYGLLKIESKDLTPWVGKKVKVTIEEDSSTSKTEHRKKLEEEDFMAGSSSSTHLHGSDIFL